MILIILCVIDKTSKIRPKRQKYKETDLKGKGTVTMNNKVDLCWSYLFFII